MHKVLVYLFLLTALILMFSVQNSIMSRDLPIKTYPDPPSVLRQENQDRLQNLKVTMQEYVVPNNQSWPLYPLFDHQRNLVWVGDTVIDSGRIWSFNLTNAKFKEHDLNDTSIVTILALDSNNTIWYLDPLLKRVGFYNTSLHPANHVYPIRTNVTIFGMTMDKNDTMWMTSPDNGEVLRFDTKTKEFKPVIHLPFPDSRPLGITFDKPDTIWIADERGSIIKINSSDVRTINQYRPQFSKGNILPSPTAILVVPDLNSIFVSNHNDKSITSFNTVSNLFGYYRLNTTGLPFGMAIDKFGDIWIAQHTSNKIIVLNPSSGNLKEFSLIDPHPYVQWITSDSNGNIWMAEQLVGSLGHIRIKEDGILNNQER
jgi:copper transport protein